MCLTTTTPPSNFKQLALKTKTQPRPPPLRPWILILLLKRPFLFPLLLYLFLLLSIPCSGNESPTMLLHLPTPLFHLRLQLRSRISPRKTISTRFKSVKTPPPRPQPPPPPLLLPVHYGTKPGYYETLRIHFPTSKGVSEVSEQANE